MMIRTLLAAATAALVLTAGTAQAQTPLKDVAYVRDGIIDVGIAYEISEQCSSISARTIRGLLFLRELQAYAREQGYSDAQIDAYIDNKAEQRRLERLARARLAAMGAVDGNEASICAVGRKEIAANTRIGSFLR